MTKRRYGAVRHDPRKVEAAYERSKRKSPHAVDWWREVKRVGVEVTIRRDMTYSTPVFRATACPASGAVARSLSIGKGFRHGCRGGEGKSPTEAYRRALRELSKAKR